MVTTVTLSPSVDKTVTLSGLKTGGVNRAESVLFNAGGKGINVSLALSSLGEKSEALGLIFDKGEIITEALSRAGVAHSFISCPGGIRCNTKIYDRASGITTEINEKNPGVPPSALSDLKKLVAERCLKSDILVLSGSVPPGTPPDIYLDLAEAARRENPDIKIILDSSGEPFLRALDASPYLIKPNTAELEEAFGEPARTPAEVVSLSRRLIEKYHIGVVLASCGAGGAYIVTPEEALFAPPCKISPKSAQGAGDAMTAGACLAVLRDLGAGNILRYGTCAACGSVELEGTAFCTRTRFEELLCGCEAMPV